MSDRSEFFRGPPPSLGRIPEHLREAARRGIAKARQELDETEESTDILPARQKAVRMQTCAKCNRFHVEQRCEDAGKLKEAS